MYDPRNNNPYDRGRYGQNPYGNPYGQQQYQYPGMSPYGQVSSLQASSLISKVMGLLAIAFIVTTFGAAFGMSIGMTLPLYFMALIGGFVCLIALQAMVNKQGWNLFLLYLFTFLEGMSIGPLIGYYLRSPALAPILTEAFLITAITAGSLGVFAWLTKTDFSRLGHYLFVGLIIIIVASLLNLLIFHSSMLVLLITIAGIGIFCGYMLFDVQRARYMPDTMPSAIIITVNLFLNVLNLFLLILRLLTILQGSDRD